MYGDGANQSGDAEDKSNVGDIRAIGITEGKQGVLLLNAGLTVRKDEANSHKHLKWNLFTDAVIDLINEQSENVVFLLWGSFAQKKGKLIDREKHLVLESGHPSPLSANRGMWFGNNHFKLTNEYLKVNAKIEIEW